MARNPNQAVLKKLRDNLNRVVSDRADRLAVSLSEELTDLFVHNAKKRLDDATPSGLSVSKIETVKNNIISNVSESSMQHAGYISVLADPEGLNMFLEFGTGIVGLGQPHEEAGLYGWKYANNLLKYRSHGGARVGSGKLGWFFSSTKDTYIDANDEHPVIAYKQIESLETVKPHIRNGIPVSGYNRKKRIRTVYKKKINSVFTQGLRPIRYFYRTKEEIREVIAEIKRRAKDSDKSLRALSDELIDFIESKKM